jgi:hypothetical protein
MSDSDIDIVAAFDALREQLADPGLPPASVVAAVRRRRRRAQALSVAAAAAIVGVVAILIPLLVSNNTGPTRPAANPTPTIPASAGGLNALRHLPPGPVHESISIDGGRFRIDPEPSGYQPRVPASVADDVVRRWNSDVPVAVTPAYGRVTISSTVTGSLPQYQSRSAWITVIPPSPGGSCPGFPGTGAPRGTPMSVTVLLTDADTGHSSIVFQSAGLSLCGGDQPNPTAYVAAETFGLKWTLLGQRPDPTQAGYVDWHISYRVPSCALSSAAPGLASSSAGRTMLYVEADMPIDRPAHCPSSTETTWFGPERQDGSPPLHALTGRHYY